MFFNGFTLLLCVMSFMAGAVWLNSLDKAIRKAEAKKRSQSDTPIYDTMVRDYGSHR